MDAQGWRPGAGDSQDVHVQRGPSQGWIAAVAAALVVAVVVTVLVLDLGGGDDPGLDSAGGIDDVSSDVQAEDWVRPEVPAIEAPDRFATGVVRGWGGPGLVRPDQVQVWVLSSTDGARAALVAVDAVGRPVPRPGAETVDVGGRTADIHRDELHGVMLLGWGDEGTAVSLTARGLDEAEVLRLAEGMSVTVADDGTPTANLGWLPDDLEVLVERSGVGASSGTVLQPVGGTGAGGIQADFVPVAGQGRLGGFTVTASRDRAVTARDLAAVIGHGARPVVLPGDRRGVLYRPALSADGSLLIVDGADGVTLAASSDLLPPNQLMTAVAGLDLDVLADAAIAQSGGRLAVT